MTRKKMMAGNWKMNNSIAEAVVLTQQISNRCEKDWDKDVDIVICPPAVDLKAVWTVLDFDKVPVSVGGQNVYWEESGAYTGEISVHMLSETGATYCIVGHSERRGLFFESDDDVNRKVKALLQGKLVPIVCVGESLTVRDEGTTNEFVCKQLRAAFAGLSADEAATCVIAYEPIWAIGTGRTATPEQAQEVCAALRTEIASMFDGDISDDVRILYGGSMKPANVEGLMAMEDIDGGLIGGASLVADDFITLVKACL